MSLQKPYDILILVSVIPGVTSESFWGTNSQLVDFCCNLITVQHRVPQGSVLGPLLYSVLNKSEIADLQGDNVMHCVLLDLDVFFLLNPQAL